MEWLEVKQRVCVLREGGRGALNQFLLRETASLILIFNSKKSNQTVQVDSKRKSFYINEHTNKNVNDLVWTEKGLEGDLIYFQKFQNGLNN